MSNNKNNNIQSNISSVTKPSTPSLFKFNTIPTVSSTTSSQNVISSSSKPITSDTITKETTDKPKFTFNIPYNLNNSDNTNVNASLINNNLNKNTTINNKSIPVEKNVIQSNVNTNFNFTKKETHTINTENDLTNKIVEKQENVSNIYSNKFSEKEIQENNINNKIKEKIKLMSANTRPINIGVRPKPKLDYKIEKINMMKKVIDNEADKIYDSVIESSTENIIKNMYSKEIIINQIFYSIISDEVKKIVNEVVEAEKSEEQIFKNYDQALILYTNDIINEVVTETLKDTIEEIYNNELEKKEKRDLEIKKERLQEYQIQFQNDMRRKNKQKIFSKWHYLLELNLYHKKLREDEIRKQKIDFDNVVKLIDIGPDKIIEKKNNNLDKVAIMEKIKQRKFMYTEEKNQLFENNYEV